MGGILALKGEAQTKLTEAHAGDTVVLARLEGVATGDTLSLGKKAPARPKIEHLVPSIASPSKPADRKDEVKLTAAIAKLREEDPSLHFDQNAELQEMALEGQGEIHLKVAVEKLQSKYGLKLNTRRPRVPYKETIKKSVTQHGRHKRQSGRSRRSSAMSSSISSHSARQRLYLHRPGQGLVSFHGNGFLRSKKASSNI